MIYIFGTLGKQYKIRVIMANGRELHLNIASSDKVIQVRRKIEKLYGINVKNQIMWSKGIKLKTEDVLYQIGVKDGATLVMSYKSSRSSGSGNT